MPKLSEIQIRDPFIVNDGDDYYLFGSTDPDIWKSDGIGFDVYRAVGDRLDPPTLAEWEGPIPAFRPGPDFYSKKNFWAPEVYQVGDDWFLFATFKPFAPAAPPVETIGSGGEELRRGTAILKSSTGSIIGPYEPWSDGPVTPPDWETLDGTLYIDDAGDPWMVFCHEWQQVGDGTVEAMRLTPDLRAAASSPVTLFRASDARWSAPLPERAPGSYVTDGPFIYRDSRGYLKCLWSSFGPERNYLIGEAVSMHDDGTPAGITGPWHQAPEPLFSADGGHGMLFTGPDTHGYEDGMSGADSECLNPDCPSRPRRYLAVHSPNKTPNERAHFFEVTEATAPAVSGPAGWLHTTGRVIS